MIALQLFRKVETCEDLISSLSGPKSRRIPGRAMPLVISLLSWSSCRRSPEGGTKWVFVVDGTKSGAVVGVYRW